MKDLTDKLRELIDSIKVELAGGIHDYSECPCGRSQTRRGKCVACLIEEYPEQPVGKVTGKTLEGKEVTGWLFMCKYDDTAFIILEEYSADELIHNYKQINEQSVIEIDPASITRPEGNNGWIKIEEISLKDDTYYIAVIGPTGDKYGDTLEWLWFNGTWFYAKSKKPYPRFVFITHVRPTSMPESMPIPALPNTPAEGEGK